MTVHRPRGHLGHLAALASPAAAAALRVATERDARRRFERLRDATRDRIAQHVRPTRPTMRSLVAAPGGRLRWRELPTPPAPGPLGAVVHPIAVATCDLDRALLLGSAPFALPLCFGHECVAEVLRIGNDVTSVKVGQRVVVPFQISCGQCDKCRHGLTANCHTVPPISMYGFGVAGGHWGGALSDELAVPFADAMLIPLPDGVDAAAAASVADNVSDGFRHVGPHLPAVLARDPDAEVRIIVAQDRHSPYSASIPLYAGLIAKALGARHVRILDARSSVRQQATSLGLDAVASHRGLGLAPLVIDASAQPPGLRRALSCTAPDGICTSSGALHRSIGIPITLLYGRNATLHVGRTHARAIIPEVLALMTEGRLRPELITTNVATIDDAPRALRDHAVSDTTKTVLVER